MKKENIYVSVRTPEECKRAYEILCRAGEKIYRRTEIRLETGTTDVHDNPFIIPDEKDGSWIGCGEQFVKDKTLITLDQLESMLCGKGEEKTVLTIKEIKEKMLAHRDFFGGDIMYTDEIKKSTSKKQLAKIMDRYRNHLENMAVDATSHHDNFKQSLGLNYL